MNQRSTLAIAAAAALVLSPAGALATNVRPADAVINVSPALLPKPQAQPEKSQGLPGADGDKPGNGNGYGHLKGVGRGHEHGRGHGHDGDPVSP